MKFTVWRLQEGSSVLSCVCSYKISLIAQAYPTTISNPGLSEAILHPVIVEILMCQCKLWWTPKGSVRLCRETASVK